MYTPYARSPNGTSEDCVLCIDVSPSMNDRDFKPSRLKAARIAAKRFIELKRNQHPNDRVALVSFAECAYLKHALGAVRERTLDSALDNLITHGCTNISAGLALAARVLWGEKVSVRQSAAAGFTGLLNKLLFQPQPSPALTCEGITHHTAAQTRRLIVLSDGSSNTGADPISTAQNIKRQGVMIDVIGIGQRSSSDFDEKTAKAIASPNRYWWIGDTQALVQKFEQLGKHLQKL